MDSDGGLELQRVLQVERRYMRQLPTIQFSVMNDRHISKLLEYDYLLKLYPETELQQRTCFFNS